MERIKKGDLWRSISVIGGVALNVALAFLTSISGFPMYFDTIGTIGVAAFVGIYPGILTAVLTDAICLVFNSSSIYYSIVNVLVACVSAFFFRNKYHKKAKGIIAFILSLALVGGGVGGLVQLIIIGHPEFLSVDMSSQALATGSGLNYYLSFFIINIGLNLVDKGISAAVVLIAKKYVPADFQSMLRNSRWKQQPLSPDEIKRYTGKETGKKKLQRHIFAVILLMSVSMLVVMCLINVQIYYDNEKTDYQESAYGAVKLAASALDPGKIDDYLKKGRSEETYDETERELFNIYKAFPRVKYLYVLKIEEDGCHFVFDMEADEDGDVVPFSPGEVVEFESAFQKYVPDLLAGREIEPIESNDAFGWLMTVYYPVRDAAGNTACYVGADVSIQKISGYTTKYLIKTILIFSGFFVLVLAYGLWLSKYHLVHPINSMAFCTSEYVYDINDTQTLQDNVRKIQSLKISTGDELENLYKSICKMTEDTAEQVNDIRLQNKRINQMQSGLIITMADMVESRDADTGFHIQKTAEYVRIILAGLKDKGYYADRLTPKYIEDVEMSAPLHDIGKINIPDAVLNKETRLSEEEYEIMKRHTIEGKKILEKAINSVSGENYLKEARNMAAYHHERWDGKGYPEGLKGTVIPLSARIMAVADVFDALTSKRVYKAGMTYEEAMGMIKDGAGKQFDPKCVEVFAEAEREVRRTLRKYQD